MKKKLLSVALLLAIALVSVFAVSASADSSENDDGIKSASVNLAENITVNIAVKITDAPSDAYAVIRLPSGVTDRSQTVAAAPTVTVDTASGAVSCYVFTAKVPAKHVDAEISLRILSESGGVVLPEMTTSAAAYCENYIKEYGETGTYSDIVGALTDYSKAAKAYFGLTSEAAGLGEGDFSNISDVRTEGTIPSALKHISASLLLESETTIRHYFSLSYGDYIANYVFFVDRDGDGKCSADERLAPNVKIDENGRKYFVDINGITPNELATEYKLSVYKMGAEDSVYSCYYGALTYAKRTYNGGSESAANDLAVGLKSYSDSAGRLFGKVTYKTGDGSPVQTTVYKYGVYTPITAAPTRDGFVFDGWYDENDNRVTVIAPSQTEDVELTARWALTKTSYNIEYPSGATLPAGAPTSYIPGVKTALPEMASKTENSVKYILLGWYLDAALTKPIDSIPATACGNFCVYAKWSRAIVANNFDDNMAGISSNGKLENGMLNWSPKSGNTIMTASNLSTYAEVLPSLSNKAITIRLDVKKAADADIAKLRARVIATVDGVSQEQNFLYINADGSVGTTSFNGKLATVSDTDFTRLEVVVDFDDAKLKYYVNGELVAIENAKALYPIEYYSEAARSLNIRCEGDGTLYFDNISITLGDTANPLYGGYGKAMIDDEYGKGDFGKLSRLEAVLAVKDKFVGSDEFGEAELMPSGVYEIPPFTPTEGQHPRIMLTSDMIPAIKAVLEDPKYAALAQNFWSYADADDVDGIMPKSGTVTHKNGTPNDTSDDYKFDIYYDAKELAKMEAKALAYLLTGEEFYAYEAIYAAKNTILTLRSWRETQQDTYHDYSNAINIISLIYDWCYDALTDEDKDQLIGGIRNYLLPYIEFKYPPSNMGHVSGHGTGTQMFRDWLTLAAAVADERPDWWNFVGGRFYQDYIPVVEYMYSSGYVPQGTNYGPSKYFGHIWGAYLLETMGDEKPYGTGMNLAPYNLLSQIMPNGSYFQTGDAANGKGHTPYGDDGIEYHWMFLAAAQTDDPVVLEYALKYSNGATVFNNGGNQRMTSTLMAILIAACDGELSGDETELDLITYNGHPGGQTSIRNSWCEDAVAVLMKVGDRTMANHDHHDSGAFQIYYKGLLACDSGYYTGVLYGKNHWKYYQTATVAHNGMLVYDPAYRDTLPEAERKYYSGSQPYLPEASTTEQWHGGKYDVAKIMGHAEGYTAGGDAEYAYIAGDMTNAYEAQTVKYVGRSMLTVMQNGSDVPMIMFVYDDVESSNTAAIKKFLLHTVNEPTIDPETNTVIATEGEGKLVLTPLIGVEKIEKIGGEGKEYWVGEDGENGYNVTDGLEDYDQDKDSDMFGYMWGRVELSATGESTNRMLNAIYVTDIDSTASVDFTVIDTSLVAGAYTDELAAVFFKSRSLEVDNVSFTTEGDGNIEYYICGIKDCTWVVKVNGKEIGEMTPDKDSGFLKFNAPAGEVTLSPKIAYIDYEMNGGTLPEDAPDSYVAGEGLSTLPTPTHRYGYEFLGWYTDSLFENRITEIPVSSIATVTLYAKWNKNREIYLDNDGSSKNGIATGSARNEWEVIFDGKDTDGDGSKDAIEWSVGAYTGDIAHPTIVSNGAPIAYSTMIGNEHVVSFTVDIALIEGYGSINTTFRIGSNAVLGGTVSIFMIDNSGNVFLGNTKTVITTLSTTMQSIKIAVDFDSGKIYAYKPDGSVVSTTFKSLSDKADTTEEWRQLYIKDVTLFNWYVNKNNGSAERYGYLIGGIKIEETNVFD